MKTRLIFSVAAATAACLLAGTASACTGIQLTAQDGSVVHARTLEFGEILPPVIVAIPKGIAQVGMTLRAHPASRKTSPAVGMGMQAIPSLPTASTNRAWRPDCSIIPLREIC
jgi:choloylglycine hydrolase